MYSCFTRKLFVKMSDLGLKSGPIVIAFVSLTLSISHRTLFIFSKFGPRVYPTGSLEITIENSVCPSVCQWSVGPSLNMSIV